MIRPALSSTIQIQEEFMGKSDTVLCDPNQMFQVVMHLCTNAGEAMSKRGGVLNVSLTEIVLDQEGAVLFPELTPQAPIWC